MHVHHRFACLAVLIYLYSGLQLPVPGRVAPSLRKLKQLPNRLLTCREVFCHVEVSAFRSASVKYLAHLYESLIVFSR
jgi:hypothetical protein